jgi:hypothetical protein
LADSPGPSDRRNVKSSAGDRQMAARDTTVGSTPIGSAMPLGSGRKSSGWGMVRRHDRQGPQRCTGGWRLANLNDVVAVKHQRSAIGSQQVRFSEGLWSFLNHPIRFSLVRWGLEKGCSGPEDRVRASFCALRTHISSPLASCGAVLRSSGSTACLVRRGRSFLGFGAFLSSSSVCT